LRRNRTLSVSVVGTLALALGAGVATFAIAEAALITPPPFPEPDRLAMLYTTHTEPARGTERVRWSYRRFRMLENTIQGATAIAGYGLSNINLAGTSDAEPVQAEVVAGRYFTTLDVQPARGRVFSSSEDRATSGAPVAIIGHELWRRRYNADPGILGQVLRVNSSDLTIVGIMPAGFTGLTGRAELWFP